MLKNFTQDRGGFLETKLAFPLQHCHVDFLDWKSKRDFLLFHGPLFFSAITFSCHRVSFLSSFAIVQAFSDIGPESTSAVVGT